jgi:prepilin-type N-terminal cleavage/methylation domain-containing protein
MKKTKGFTLPELIISIALISIVVVFLFRLFTDLEYTNNQKDYCRNNQQTRAIIIKRVQDDFLDYGLVGLNDDRSTDSKLVVNFTFGDSKTGVLTVEKYTVTYQDASGDTEKWVLDKENDYMGYDVNCVDYTIYKNSTNNNNDYFYLNFSIPLRYKSDSENSIDDLEFSYTGKKSDINISNFKDSAHLGNYKGDNYCKKTTS